MKDQALRELIGQNVTLEGREGHPIQDARGQFQIVHEAVDARLVDIEDEYYVLITPADPQKRWFRRDAFRSIGPRPSPLAKGAGGVLV